VKALTKLSDERKINLQKIKLLNEKEVIQGAISFFTERLNAEVMAFSEDDTDRYDPKQKAQFALPNQPAIFIE
jgi:primosomal protein N''